VRRDEAIISSSASLNHTKSLHAEASPKKSQSDDHLIGLSCHLNRKQITKLRSRIMKTNYGNEIQICLASRVIDHRAVFWKGHADCSSALGKPSALEPGSKSVHLDRDLDDHGRLNTARLFRRRPAAQRMVYCRGIHATRNVTPGERTWTPTAAHKARGSTRRPCSQRDGAGAEFAANLISWRNVRPGGGDWTPTASQHARDGHTRPWPTDGAGCRGIRR